MKWVYILKCEDDHFYVGETSRLYRRFWEHQSGNGGVNTSILKPQQIVAIYKVDTICKFIDYNDYVNKIVDGIWHDSYNGFKLRDFDVNNEYSDNLEAENTIAECFMIHHKEWQKIKGGKYTRFDIDYTFPENEYLKQLPLCNCGLPCDIKKNDNNFLFFRCAKKNMWGKMKEEFGIEDPCTFFMEYTKDKQLRMNEMKQFEDRKIILKELFKKSSWLEKVDIGYSCIGCGSTTKATINYSNQPRTICYDCFINKNEEIAKKYIGKCLISI